MISSCDATGRALHPTPLVTGDNDDVIEYDNVFWRIMSFFESYANLQVCGIFLW